MEQRKFRIKDLPKAERPREKLISKGPQNLKDEELLVILLRTGREGKDVLELARQILRKYSKKRFLKMSHEDLIKIKGINSAKACTILAAMVIYLNARGEMVYKKPMFIGTLNANLVHPREIFAEALKQKPPQ